MSSNRLRAGTGARQVRAKASNALWEAVLGINTRGRLEVNTTDSYWYATVPYTTIFSVLAALQLGPDDVFVDIGCGRGRVLCCAARSRLKQVVGVELDGPLAEAATRNATSLRRRRTPIVVQHLSATEHDYSDVTVVFLFNPFGRDTLSAVLAKLEADRGSRPTRLAYVQPVHQQELVDRGWRQTDEVVADASNDVSFWTWDPAG